MNWQGRPQSTNIVDRTAVSPAQQNTNSKANPGNVQPPQKPLPQKPDPATDNAINKAVLATKLDTMMRENPQNVPVPTPRPKTPFDKAKRG